MITVLHEQGAPCTSSAMDQAAAHGHLEVVQFLHEHRTEGASMTAMNLAAANGHFAVLQFLHRNRREGCSGLAYSLAAAQGRIDVLNWLKENTTQNPSPFSMDEAAAAGQVAALQWLKDNGCTCTARAIDRAACNGHLAAVQWLTANTSSGFTYSAVDDTASHGHKEVLVHLIAHGATPVSSTLTLAAINNHVDIAAWLITLGVTPTVELDQICTAKGMTKLVRYLHALADECRASPHASPVTHRKERKEMTCVL